MMVATARMELDLANAFGTFGRGAAAGLAPAVPFRQSPSDRCTGARSGRLTKPETLIIRLTMARLHKRPRKAHYQAEGGD